MLKQLFYCLDIFFGPKKYEILNNDAITRQNYITIADELKIKEKKRRKYINRIK